MAGHIQNVLRMYPLDISGSHSRVYLKCTQHLITGHIGVTCCLCSQCVHNVPSGYLGPCPQCWLRFSRVSSSMQGPRPTVSFLEFSTLIPLTLLLAPSMPNCRVSWLPTGSLLITSPLVLMESRLMLRLTLSTTPAVARPSSIPLPSHQRMFLSALLASM